MYFTVYKIINLINNKIYVGIHRTLNLEDSYMGSGILIKKAIEKYGEKYFLKGYIEIFDNKEEMYALEKKIVNEEFINRFDTYNIAIGGHTGDFSHVNDRGLNLYGRNRENMIIQQPKGTLKHLELIKDFKYLTKWKKSLSNAAKSHYDNGGKNPFQDKVHSEETKNKMRETHKKNKNSIGEKNSQYGTCWIYSIEKKVNRKINKKDLLSYENLGWIKGRKMKFN